jgi:hypothetical protein
MVHLGVLEQARGAEGGEGVFPDDRLDIVVEVDDVGFPEA